MSGNQSSRQRIPALDALRGIAVLMVVVFHLTEYMPAEPLSRIQVLTNLGWTGVDLFFVLSGFLITGILLEAKERREAGQHDYFRRFYLRRVRRIVPVSYLTLATVWFVVPMLSSRVADEVARARDAQPWYWLYLNNWRVEWMEIPFVFHYWSLAVEEQFYLVWPLVVLLSRTIRRLGAICITCLAAGPILRCALLLGGVSADAISLNTLTRLDGLAWGSLIAVAFADAEWRASATRIARRSLAPLGYALLLVFVVTRFDPKHFLMLAVGYSLLTGMAAAVVAVAAGSPTSQLTRGLASAWPLQRIGLISYGIYVYHVPLRDIAMMHGWSVPAWTANWGSYLLAQLAYFAVIGGASILLAAASWRWLERPILQGRIRKRAENAPAAEVNG